MIETKNVVSDVLHLFLRICDVLVNLLILGLCTMVELKKPFKTLKINKKYYNL